MPSTACADAATFAASEVRSLEFSLHAFWGEVPMRIGRLACCLVFLVGILAFRFDAASAQGSPEQQQACTPDAMRLCADVIPDVAKVTACMNAKYSQLSEACRVAMRGSGGGKAVHHHRYRHCRHHCG